MTIKLRQHFEVNEMDDEGNPYHVHRIKVQVGDQKVLWVEIDDADMAGLNATQKKALVVERVQTLIAERGAPAEGAGVQQFEIADDWLTQDSVRIQNLLSQADNAINNWNVLTAVQKDAINRQMLIVLRALVDNVVELRALVSR